MTEEKTKVEDLNEAETAAVSGAETDLDGVAGQKPEKSEEQVADPILSEAEQEAAGVGSSVLRIEALEVELAQARDQALRAHAEVMNIKRRAEQDVEKAHKFALDKFVGELIPVVESLEKGIENAEQGEGQHETMLEGMRLTHKQLLGALAKFSVEQVDPVGQPFDPNFHQAISMVPNPDMEPNTVMEVFQKGYTLHGRVIRPAMVVVAKAV